MLEAHSSERVVELQDRRVQIRDSDLKIKHILGFHARYCGTADVVDSQRRSAQRGT